MNAFTKQLFIFLSITLATILTTSSAWAGCYFFITKGTFSTKTSDAIVSKSTHVVLMREGARTVLSTRPHYRGPVKDFAMVLPVPELLAKEQVKTLPPHIFDELEASTSPGIKDFEEVGHCSRTPSKPRLRGLPRVQVKMSKGRAIQPSQPKEVVLEGEFVVGEYEVVILSAKESNALESWLNEHGYNIPEGASKALAPYIAQGMYFFVAKVNADKVTFDKDGNALLSPLRFHYHSYDFSLPVRLGLLNADGEQELLIHILSRHGRYKVANYRNAFIPTDLAVPESVRENLDAFYSALLDYTWRRNPGAVITEHVWDTDTCERCIWPRKTPENFVTLGWDQILEAAHEQEIRVVTMPSAFTTRYPNAALTKALEEHAFTQTANLTYCYGTFLDASENKPSGRMAFTAEVTPFGTLTSIETAWNGLHDATLEACLTEQLASWKLEDGIPSQTTSVELFLKLDRKVRKVHHLATSSRPWTITRMRARYSPGDLGEDLIFERAPSITGGFEAPEGRKPTTSAPWVELTRSNRFLARYLILDADSSPPEHCPSGESWQRRWVDRSIQARPHTPVKSTIEPYTLSKAARRAVDEQFKHQDKVLDATLEQKSNLHHLDAFKATRRRRRW